jgi:hypothetical protein
MASPIPQFPQFSLNPCCVDQMGTCGTMLPMFPGVPSMGGGGCTPPPMPDQRCPNVSSQLGAMAGCCTNNNCGVIVFNTICVDTTNPMAAMFLPGVMAKHCDGTPVMTATGGSTGAGGGGGASGSAGAAGGGGASGAAGAAGGGGTAGASGSAGASGAAGSSGASGAAGSGGSR